MCTTARSFRAHVSASRAVRVDYARARRADSHAIVQQCVRFARRFSRADAAVRPRRVELVPGAGARVVSSRRIGARARRRSAARGARRDSPARRVKPARVGRCPQPRPSRRASRIGCDSCDHPRTRAGVRTWRKRNEPRPAAPAAVLRERTQRYPATDQARTRREPRDDGERGELPGGHLYRLSFRRCHGLALERGVHAADLRIGGDRVQLGGCRP